MNKVTDSSEEDAQLDLEITQLTTYDASSENLANSSGCGCGGSKSPSS